MSQDGDERRDEPPEGSFAQQLDLLRKADVANLFPDYARTWKDYSSDSKIAAALGFSQSGFTARKQGKTALDSQDMIRLADRFRFKYIGLDARIFGLPDIAAFEARLEEKRYFRFEEGAWLERIEFAIDAAQASRPDHRKLAWRDQDGVELTVGGRSRVLGQVPRTRDVLPVAAPPRLRLGRTFEVRVTLDPRRSLKMLAGVLNPCLKFRWLPGSDEALQVAFGKLPPTTILADGLEALAPEGRHHLIIFALPGTQSHPLLKLGRRYGPAATPVDLAQLHNLVMDPESLLVEARRLTFDIIDAKTDDWPG